MRAAKWWAIGTLAALQLADLGTTWIGLGMGLRECDGTSLGTLLVVKLAVTVGILVLCWDRRGAMAVAAAVMVAVYVPIVGSNVVLILRAGGAL